MIESTKILDIIAIFSAIGSAGFWLASYKISVGLEIKIDRMMLVLSTRMQRQQDRNKSEIGILKAETSQLKNMFFGGGSCITLDEIIDHLPEETTDFS
jgi:hypothetical protein